MSSFAATLQIDPVDPNSSGALSSYLKEDASRSRERLPGSLAAEAISGFESGLRKLIDRCEEFLESDEKQVSHLVLGKVQSGKTAHLLGSLAWTADSEVLAAAVFTGITGSLNDQTQSRLIKDLENLPGSPAKVLVVPTVSQSKKFSKFIEELTTLARARAAGDPASALPVLVSMKNPSRARAVSEAFSILSATHGKHKTVLLIDDEADQASQNAKARQRSIAATYDALSKIRNLPLRNIWLSYTATPQAVLLTEKFGTLRPDYVSIVPPRSGYFGLDDVTSDSYAKQMVEVSDWRIQARNATSAPQSLIDAIWRFLFVAWVRKRHPKDFYSLSPVKFEHSKRLNSTQMLIHESSMKADHSRMFKLVADELQQIEVLVEELISGRVVPQTREAFCSGFESVAETISANGASASALLSDFLSAEGQLGFLELLRDTNVIVVNSDGSSPTAGEPRPVDDDDYAKYPAWILIGGDILGRGITIPQLTVSYFLRTSKTPNLDTVLQQLRFCGYRQDYKNWTSIHASRLTFDDLKYMAIVDKALWTRASSWDREQTKLSGAEMPSVFYASSKSARFEPTRISVRDPDLIDRKIDRGSLFSLRDIFEPRDFRSNLALLRRWVGESDLQPHSVDSNWLRLDDLSPALLGELLFGWETSTAEKAKLRAISEIFDPELGSLGLSDTPNVVYISRLLTEVWAEPELILDKLDEVEVTRAASAPSGPSRFSEWSTALKKIDYLPSDSRARLAVGHIGGGQRALKNRIEYETVVFIVEPILGLSASRDRTSLVALGIGLAALSPDNFEIRTIGHA